MNLVFFWFRQPFLRYFRIVSAQYVAPVHDIIWPICLEFLC